MVSAHDLAHALDAMIAESVDHDAVYEQFLAFVENRNLTALLPQVVTELERARNVKSSAVLTIESARPLSESSLKSIKAFVGADDTAAVESAVCEDLIGGFRATYSDTLYDASIATSLLRLKQELSR